MSMNNINPHQTAYYEAYKNPSHGIRLMTLEDFKWLAENKPQNDDWISGAWYSKRQHFHEKLSELFMNNIACCKFWGSHVDAEKAKLMEINKYIETFLGYTPTPREPSRWG
jgi:hypothetical protein